MQTASCLQFLRGEYKHMVIVYNSIFLQTAHSRRRPNQEDTCTLANQSLHNSQESVEYQPFFHKDAYIGLF